MADAQDLSCAQLVELVTDYLEHALPPDERARFEEHLAVCDGCSSYLEQMRLSIELTGRLRIDDFAPAVRTELVRAFRGWLEDSPG